MFLETLIAARDFGRVHEIASILIRYGFGDMVRRLGMVALVERAGHALNWREIDELTHLEPPERVRKVLEEMGPTFVKLGQILATRPDLFDEAWITEFEKLQDQAQPVPYADILPQLTEDLGAPPEQVFAKFDPTPIAAASIGQVHRARLIDGSEVVVKIRRPGIRATVESDLRLLENLAEMAGREIKALNRYQPEKIVRQFALSLRRELDLAVEARNSERLRHNFQGYDDIIIPEIFWPWTSERVNVQRYVQGIPGHDLEALNQAGLDRTKLAKVGADAVLKMMLIDGVFHADPHPGNCFFLPGNRIAFIDFGMIGRLSDNRRFQVIDLLHGLVNKEPEKVVRILLSWTETPPDDEESLMIEVDQFIDRYHGVSLKNLHMGELLGNLTSLIRDHKINLPADLSLLIKAFMTLEGLGRQLDPEFNLVVTAAPRLKTALLLRYHPETLGRKSLQSALELARILIDLPKDVQRIVEDLRKGAIGVRLHVNRPDWLGAELDRVVNRLSVSLVTAAMIIGGSIVSTVEGGAGSFIGMIAFIGSLLGGLWLLLSIWRSG
ncbi:MAG: AarF/UbiB family protein [Methylococcales bacterium]|nr:AarF/UbiB family protein [Methylococcales bacterium]